MSRIRVYIDGRPDWKKVDEGMTPHRSSWGIRLATADDPIQVSAYVPSSKYDGRAPRPGAHTAKVKP